MPILSGIIAKVLMFTESILDNWVTVQDIGGTGDLMGECYNFPIIQATPDACLSNFTGDIADIIEGLVALTPQLLAALFATEVTA